MDAQTSEPRTRGEKLAEGKTKIIFADLADPLGTIVHSQDDITAGDGAKHHKIPNKGIFSNRMTCNVFELLKACGIPLAYNERVDERGFSSKRVEMLPLEVVARREGGHGKNSPLRFPHIAKGTIFPRLVFETFLKTKDKVWNGGKLPCDDPHAVWSSDKKGFDLYDVTKPFIGQEPFRFITGIDVFDDCDGAALLKEMESITRQVFLIWERAWQLQGRRALDFKIEFALWRGKLVVADVIDADSGRITKDGMHEDKQLYRDDGALSEVAKNFLRLAELSDRFELPTQGLFVWRGSEQDSVDDIVKALGKWRHSGITDVITCSMHKEPVKGFALLNEIERDFPDSVIIALIGMSNGAGPILQAHTTMQVINCSPTVEKHPEDVWSSLRMPSEVPCLTALSPANAAHAALNILSMRNPAVYAALRYRMEERFVNTIPL